MSIPALGISLGAAYLDVGHIVLFFVLPEWHISFFIERNALFEVGQRRDWILVLVIRSG